MVVGAGVQIGRRCRIAPNAVIDDRVMIGDDTVIGACASLSHCLIGNRVSISPGVPMGRMGSVLPWIRLVLCGFRNSAE